MKNTDNGVAAPKQPFQERNLYLTWEGWCIDLFTTEDGKLGITIDQPNPGMSTDPDAECPSVDIFVTPDLVISHDGREEVETPAQAEIRRKYETYSDYHKDFYGCRPDDDCWDETPEQIAARYDAISAEHQKLKETREGRDKLRARSWIVEEPCRHCGKPIEQNVSLVWFHTDTVGPRVKFCTEMQTSVAEPEPYATRE